MTESCLLLKRIIMPVRTDNVCLSIIIILIGIDSVCNCNYFDIYIHTALLSTIVRNLMFKCFVMFICFVMDVGINEWFGFYVSV